MGTEIATSSQTGRSLRIPTVASALTAAALLAGLMVSGCQEKPKADDTTQVLHWRRDIRAGCEVSAADVMIVKLPNALVESLDAVMRREDISIFAKPCWLGRNVRRGDFVSRQDLQAGPPAVATASRPAGQTMDWEKLPTGDPKTVEAEGRLKRYITTTRTADGREIMDFSSTPSAPPGPTELTTHPLQGLGLEKLGEKVPDVVAPAGARRIYGFRQKVPGGHCDNLAYVAPVDLPAAVKFYKTRLQEAGYRFVGRRPAMRPGGATLIFAKDRKHNYLVTLHPADKGKSLRIVLMIARPDDKQP